MKVLPIQFLVIIFSLQLSHAAERPNFIVVIGDDISQEDFGCYGHPNIHTPNVDKLAEEGIRFDYAFLTASSCSPSRISILSGRYPHNTGAQHLHLPLAADAKTIAKQFLDAGYYTAQAGKWHFGEEINDHFHRREAGKPSGSEFWMDVLKERPKDKPFFMWLASSDAHRTWSAQDIPNPHTIDDVIVPPFLLDTPEFREDFAQYYNEVSRLDSNLGMVRKELERQGVADNTMIIFMADNGRPYARCKNTNYDSGLKTPFVVIYPPITDRNKGRVAKGLVSSIDIAPTMMDIAGLDTPSSFQGISFKPILKNPKKQVRKEVFGEKNWHDFQGHERSIRTDEYLYIRNSFPELELVPAADCWKDGQYAAILKLDAKGKLPPNFDWVGKHRPAELLFEVGKDPQQLRDLSSNPEYTHILNQMRLRLDDWVEETVDVVPTNPVPDFFSRSDGSRLDAKKRPNDHAARYMPDS